VASLPESMPLEMAGQLSADNITPMMGLDDALTAFEAAAFIGICWNHAQLATQSPNENQAPLKPKKWILPPEGMTEYEGKQLLRSFGLPVPIGTVCKIEDAVRVASKFDGSVAIKISSAKILHKTEVGGVALNLRDAAEVEAAAKRMSKLGSELLIEKMVEGSVAELIIGLTRDPQFGLALVIGAGGIFTELLKDSVTLLLPCSESEILRALKTLRIWKLIEGFRGKSGDQQATVEAIKSICKFAEAYKDQIEELDINPLFVLPKGAVAADALIKLR
jgi:acetate---CoA ligase (ADP-forming)